MSKFLELAAKRCSVRSYAPRSVEPEKIARILEAGQLAPTACNLQPQRFMVFSSAEDLAAVDECSPCRFGAPAVLWVCYDRSVCWQRGYDQASSGEIDAAIAATHMMLAIEDLGLSSCWVMVFDPAKTAQVFRLPENIVPVAMLPFGYSTPSDTTPEKHRKPLESYMLL